MLFWSQLWWATKALWLNGSTAPWCLSELILITTIIKNKASGLSGPGKTADDFRAPRIIFFFSLKVFIGGLDPTGNWPNKELQCSWFDITTALTQVEISTKASLPRFDHMPASCSFTFPILKKFPKKTQGLILGLIGIGFPVHLGNFF